jgi:hypothetical protein
LPRQGLDLLRREVLSHLVLQLVEHFELVRVVEDDVLETSALHLVGEFLVDRTRRPMVAGRGGDGERGI